MEFIKPPEDLISLIIRSKTIGIISHLEPDADCIGSSLALGSFLERINKKVWHFNSGPFDRPEIRSYASHFITPEQLPISSHTPDLFIVVDCSTIERIHPFEPMVHTTPVIVIDHHTSGKPFGSISWINPSSPSTTLLIQQLIEAMGSTPTLQEAELIFLGFATDTGYFRHLDESSSLAFEQISRIVKKGVSPKAMYYQVTGGKQLAARKHLAMLILASEELFQGKVILACETKEMTDRYGRTNRDSDGYYQQMLGVEGVEILVVLREDGDGSITGGLRSLHTWDMGKMASEFYGGGHERAAGFKIPGQMYEIKEKILGYLSELLEPKL
jgi:phosphoesterase RecJ-like protein